MFLNNFVDFNSADIFSYLSKGKQEDINEIISLLVTLNDNFSFLKYNFTSYRVLLYGLVYKIQDNIQFEGEELKPIKMDKAEFQDAKHIANYAIKIYEASIADATFHKTVNQTSNGPNLDRTVILAKGIYDRLT